MHEEMPQPAPGKMLGFQLWVNLPAKLKMCQPRYQNIAAGHIPEISRNDGVNIRVIAGVVDNVRGPVNEIAADPIYLDIKIPPNSTFSHPIDRGQTAFAYVFEGEGKFDETSDNAADNATYPRLIVFGDGDYIKANTSNQAVRFLLVSGKPLNEPIARHGPFVMNTREEIEQALEDLRNDTFVKN
jgi:redox-sensitive bicupin YhaK (pirin superfamily)